MSRSGFLQPTVNRRAQEPSNDLLLIKQIFWDGFLIGFEIYDGAFG
jgi:hypothetical protein